MCTLAIRAEYRSPPFIGLLVLKRPNETAAEYRRRTADSCARSQRLDDYLKLFASATPPDAHEAASEGIDTLIAVYFRICRDLDLHEDRDAPLRRIIAQTIIQCALDGEWDPDSLAERALESVPQQ